jgi:hypothetical protein
MSLGSEAGFAGEQHPAARIWTAAALRTGDWKNFSEERSEHGMYLLENKGRKKKLRKVYDFS